MNSYLIPRGYKAGFELPCNPTTSGHKLSFEFFLYTFPMESSSSPGEGGTLHIVILKKSKQLPSLITSSNIENNNSYPLRARECSEHFSIINSYSQNSATE